MYRIGLTGNIATGKTLVLRQLEALGAFCIDADALAHRSMKRGTAVHAAILERFGPGVVAADGEVDRAALGGVVFRDAAALADLEAIVHPCVVAEAERLIVASGASVAVIEAIKLLEASLGSRCDAIWVTTAAPELQHERLVRLRGLDAATAALRIAAQPEAAEKVRQADVLLENDGTPEDLAALVAAEWRDAQSGRGPRRDVAPAVDVRADSVTATEGQRRAAAHLDGDGTWRLEVPWPPAMPRLCRALLPALEEMARSRGLAGFTLLVPKRTGYRQFLKAMAYEELCDSGRHPGGSAFYRTL